MILMFFMETSFKFFENFHFCFGLENKILLHTIFVRLAYYNMFKKTMQVKYVQFV